MRTVAQMEAAIEKLQGEIEEKRAAERVEVLTRIREAIGVYGFSQDEIFKKKRKRSLRDEGLKKVAAKRGRRKSYRYFPKYGDEEGNRWSGQGSMPRWMKAHLEAGKKKEDFRLSEFARRAA